MGPPWPTANPRHQLIHLPRREQPQAATATTAIAIEIEHGTEVCVGVVMTPHHLPRLTHHRPGALDVQRHLSGLKAQLL